MKNVRQYTKFSFERTLIAHFMGWVTSRKPSRINILDRDKSRSRPDYAFYYNHGLKYAIELERWLPPNVRRLEAQAQRHVSRILRQLIPGTFVWSLPLDLFPNGDLPSSVARTIVSEIKSLAPNLSVFQSQPLSSGTLTLIASSGNRLVVEITAIEPVNIARNPRLMRSLKNVLEKILSKSERKFYKYHGIRVLLLSIEQSGLDIDYHATRSKYSQGIIRRWLQERIGQSTKIDYICVGQGMRVWNAAGTRLLTGHKYVDQPMPNYKEVWRRPSLPHILESYLTFSQKHLLHR